MGFSLFEHEDAINHGLAIGRYLPCPCTAPITSSHQLCNIIVLIPKKKVIETLESQTWNIGAQSVLVKWYCGCLTILMGMEMRNAGRGDKVWENLHTFWV